MRLVGPADGKWKGRPLGAKARDDHAADLKAFAAWLEDNNRVDRTPFRSLDRHKRRDSGREFERKALTENEYYRLLIAAHDRPVESKISRHPNASQRTLEKLRRDGENRSVLYAVAGLTGIRADEFRQIKWRDIHLGRNARILVSGEVAKNDKTQAVPLVVDLVPVLTEWKCTIARRLGRTPRPSEHAFVVATRPAQVIRRDLVYAGVIDTAAPLKERYDFHCMRHTAVTLLLQRSLSMVAVAQITRHDALEMQKRYAHLEHEVTSSQLDQCGVGAAVLGDFLGSIYGNRVQNRVQQVSSSDDQGQLKTNQERAGGAEQ